MNLIEKIIFSLSGEFQETPVPYGWFHIMWLGIMLLAIVVVCIYGRKLSDRTFRITLLVIAVTLILFEVYKQLDFSYDRSSDTWNYGWYYFPFQFCSVPMYAMLIAGLTRGKVQEYICCFLATFGMIGGLITMFYPATVFIPTIGICIQTMYWHATLVVVAVLMWVNGRVKLEHKSVLKGALVFVVIVILAMLMNIIFHYTGDTEQYSFNMFYISPYENSGLPVFGVLWDKLPYAVFLASYILGFSVGAYIITLVAIGIGRLCFRKNYTMNK